MGLERERPQVDRAGGIAYWRAPETFEVQQFDAYLRDLVGDADYSAGFREVIDFRGVLETGLSPEDVERMVDFQGRYQNQLIGNQRALLVAEGPMFDLWQTFASGSDNLPMEIQVFRDAAEAALWLGIEFEIFQALPARWDQQAMETCRKHPLTA